jgi:ABC-type multidrug transport system fused ATPase/permease subunit
MKDLITGIYEIARPFGRRRMVYACAILVIQAIMQLVSVLSILPFLSAAADMAQFRQSRLGTVFFWVAGDLSNSQALWTIGGLSIALLLIANALTVFSAWQSAHYAHYVGNNTRKAVLKAIMNRRYEYFLNLNSSELIKTLVEDTNTFSQYILIPTLDTIARAFVAIFLTATLALVEPLLSLWVAVIVAVYYYIVVRPARKQGLRLAVAANDSIRDIYFEVNETMGGIKPILAHDARDYFHARVARASDELAHTMPKALLMPAIPRAGLEIIVFGGMIAWLLTLLAGGTDLATIMPRVGLIALVAYRLMPSLQVIFAQSVLVSTLTESMNEVLRLLRAQDVKGRVTVSHGTAPPPLKWSQEIRFDKVSFNYAGSDRVALHDLDFAIRKGQKIAFVGSTGSGKSTLIDLLLGLLEPTSGRILIDGHELSGDHLPQWRAAVGYVPQVVFLLNTSIAENIAFGEDPKTLDMKRVRDAATAVSAMEFITSGGGFESDVGERGVRLSGGQRQRLALARAVYRNPSVLVLDEATSALDPKTESGVVAAIAAMNEDLTVINVAHRLNTIKDCDWIYFLRDGRIDASGTFDTLSRDVAAFRTFANHPEAEAEAP